MVPFAPVTGKGMFDYATGKWAPAKFKNYVTGESTTGVPSTDVAMQVGTLDPALGRSYVQIAREGWGRQKSQNGGANPTLSGPAATNYHLWAVAPEAAAKEAANAANGDLFHNRKVAVDTTLAGLVRLVKGNPPAWLSDSLRRLDSSLKQLNSRSCQGTASQLADKFASEGGRGPQRRVLVAGVEEGGFNPRIKPTESLGALAPEGRSAEKFDSTALYQGTTGVPGEPSGSGRVPQTQPMEGRALAPAEGLSTTPELQLAHKLAPIYRQTLDLYTKIAAGDLDPQSKAGLLLELDLKINQFQAALKDLLGLDLIAFTTKAESAPSGGPRGGSADETPRSVTPGQEFRVRVHTAQATTETRLNKIWLQSQSGDPWKNDLSTGAIDPAALTADPIFHVQAAENAGPTQPYFTRPNIEQPYYDLAHPEYRLRSFAPWPLSAWAEFTFDGLPIRIGQVVQTMQRVLGSGGVYEPLVVTPAIGLRIDPEARILPLDGSALPVRVTVHAQAAAEGSLELQLPSGWTSNPPEAHFHLDSAGDTEPILFSVTPAATQEAAWTIQAIARSVGRDYQTGWQSIGYPGLRPYNLYKPAQLQTRKVDVKLAPGLRVAYVMGTGDLVPQAIEALGAAPRLLTAAELASADLSAWDAIVIGIRAYSMRPELSAAQSRLNDFVRRGGNLVVLYQSGNFPAPLPLSMGRAAERVVDEQAPVKLLQPAHPLLAWPNRITQADFDGWVEERGHSFLDTWDPGYTALTETADPGQEPQRGGLLVAHPGKGTYIYVAFALHRQLPELVPGAYRLLANLLSAGKHISE